jgi:hypothetical protein
MFLKINLANFISGSSFNRDGFSLKMMAGSITLDPYDTFNYFAAQAEKDHSHSYVERRVGKSTKRRCHPPATAVVLTSSKSRALRQLLQFKTAPRIAGVFC